jgi:hypothetical protein
MDWVRTLLAARRVLEGDFLRFKLEPEEGRSS